jgi:hypothetical protein
MKLKLRRPTGRVLRRVLPIAIPLLVVGVLVVRGSRTGNFPHVKTSAGQAATSSAPPPSTAPADLTAVSLVGVGGTTTTTPIRSTGTAHLSGTVTTAQGPAPGPVPGAIVRLEHLAGPTVTTDVVAGPDGHYDAPNIAGGRYRVRAFLAPNFAQTEPPVFFLADGEQRTLDLSMENFDGFTVTSADAPDPPALNQPATLAVRVATRRVDANGIVRVQPVPSAIVDLTGITGWSVSGPPTGVTNANGDVAFTLVCRTAGTTQVQIAVRADTADQPHPATMTTSACVDTTPTTATSSSTSPPGSSKSPVPSTSPAPN